MPINAIASNAAFLALSESFAFIPQGRWGNPEDFKGPAVFLASEAASYVNGAILLVDGGWMGR